ncbi:AI-2E family transporter [Natronorubrum texcoconense]|uniref:Predicted PurR-regulated permease PerM n=1 Tax=Natronorubrum texcoconense TaxID=1095776 RepID=A0A1G9DT91_9EURY|nr:AI-2E family transporter [Natronorubrum texcoconense]SDK67069.1 Predicted PurR-regulated permease PerM [Natronorubrum texcoconense]
MIPNGDADAAWFRSRGWWWTFAFALAIVLIAALSDYLGWIVFGIFLYYVARPVSRRLHQRGLSSGTSATVTLVLVVLPFVGVLFVVASLAIVQIATLELTDFDAVLERFLPDVDTDELPTTDMELYPVAEDLATDPRLATVGQWLSGLVGRFLTASYLLFVTFLFAFFLVRDERRLGRWLRTEIVGERPNVTTYLRNVDAGLQSIFFGYTLTILAIVLLAGVVYAGFNAIAPAGLEIPQVLLLAIVTGFASVIPLVGRNIVYASIVGYLALTAIRTDPTGLWFPVAFYVVMGVLFDGIIRTYVRPTLSGRLFPTGLILFAYILGPPVFGWYGIFLGPIVMVVTVVFVQQQLPRLLHADQRTSGTGERE